jgi:hypothetical protein
MATILESLKSVSGYPVPLSAINDAAVRRGLSLSDTADEEALNSPAYRLAKADIQRWVSFAPNVSQEGTSYDLLFSDRERMREEANAIYGELGDEAYISERKTIFGYKGNRL